MQQIDGDGSVVFKQIDGDRWAAFQQIDGGVVFQQIDGALRYLDAFSTDQDRRRFPSTDVVST